jgi:hypothetical protein
MLRRLAVTGETIVMCQNCHSQQIMEKTGQGDGETLETLPAQDVYIIEFPSSFIPADILELNPGVTSAEKIMWNS